MLYLTHDKGHAASSKRVQDIYTLNLSGTTDPRLATKIMAELAARNTRCRLPVYHLSISWHPDDTFKITRSEQQSQIQEVLCQLGVKDHHALVVFHNDEPHPHAHIMVSRIHPQTLKAANLGNDYKTVMQVCRRLEMEYGLTIAPLSERENAPDLAETAIKQLTYNQATFSSRQLRTWLSKRVSDPERVNALVTQALASSDVIRLPREGKRAEKFTTKTYASKESRMFAAVEALKSRQSIALDDRKIQKLIEESGTLSKEQQKAAIHLTAGPDLNCLIGRAGAGKTTVLKTVIEGYKQQGYTVIGAAPSGQAAKVLSQETGIPARTIHSLQKSWDNGKTPPPKTVLVLDEAGLLSTGHMATTLEQALQSNMKVLLVGDPDQLRPVEAGHGFRGVSERTGFAELKTIYRQRHEWQRTASEHLASGKTAEALHAYEEKECVFWSEKRTEAQKAVAQAYIKTRFDEPELSALIVAHTNRDVTVLNKTIRGQLKEAGLLSGGHTHTVTKGEREFATGDRIVFLKNDNSEEMKVTNGTLATVFMTGPTVLSVVLDGPEARRLTFSTTAYPDIDHAYAVTAHKSQGATVDVVFHLAAKTMNQNSTYVALTRHREQCHTFADRETFKQGSSSLAKTAARENKKDLVDDYIKIKPPIQAEAGVSKKFKVQQQTQEHHHQNGKGETRVPKVEYQPMTPMEKAILADFNRPIQKRTDELVCVVRDEPSIQQTHQSVQPPHPNGVQGIDIEERQQAEHLRMPEREPQAPKTAQEKDTKQRQPERGSDPATTDQQAQEVTPAHTEQQLLAVEPVAAQLVQEPRPLPPYRAQDMKKPAPEVIQEREAEQRSDLAAAFDQAQGQRPPAVEPVAAVQPVQGPRPLPPYKAQDIQSPALGTPKDRAADRQQQSQPALTESFHQAHSPAMTEPASEQPHTLDPYKYYRLAEQNARQQAQEQNNSTSQDTIRSQKQIDRGRSFEP